MFAADTPKLIALVERATHYPLDLKWQFFHPT